MTAIRSTVAALLGVVLVYMLTAFVVWEPHPGAWTEPTRFFAATAGMMLGVFSAAAAAGLQ